MLSYQDIQNNCYNQGRPVIAGLLPSAGSSVIGHMVVITGYLNQSGSNEVILMNPTYTSYQYVTYSNLVSNSVRYWYETIDQIY